jgi:hypothetical protein
MTSEREREAQRRYAKRHPDRICEAQRRYRERNRDKLLEANRAGMQRLRDARKSGTVPQRPKTIERKCLGCPKTFLVERHGSKKRWCSSACSNRRTLVTWEDRFWARVDSSGGPDSCWPWIGPLFKDGYGHAMERGGGGARAHRIAFRLKKGELVKGLLVCHSCDNPPCCNPAHLFQGTGTDNTQDMLAKGRGRYQKGSK